MNSELKKLLVTVGCKIVNNNRTFTLMHKKFQYNDRKCNMEQSQRGFFYLRYFYFWDQSTYQHSSTWVTQNCKLCTVQLRNTSVWQAYHSVFFSFVKIISRQLMSTIAALSYTSHLTNSAHLLVSTSLWLSAVLPISSTAEVTSP